MLLAGALLGVGERLVRRRRQQQDPRVGVVEQGVGELRRHRCFRTSRSRNRWNSSRMTRSGSRVSTPALASTARIRPVIGRTSSIKCRWHRSRCIVASTSSSNLVTGSAVRSNLRRISRRNLDGDLPVKAVRSQRPIEVIDRLRNRVHACHAALQYAERSSPPRTAAGRPGPAAAGRAARAPGLCRSTSPGRRMCRG